MANMYPQFPSPGAHSSSSPAERRLNSLVRHLNGDLSASIMDSQSNNSISASPTSASHGDSVFAHVVRAPEDPILGVNVWFFSVCLVCCPGSLYGSIDLLNIFVL